MPADSAGSADPAALRAAKRALRREMAARRAAVDQEASAAAGAAIAGCLAESPAFAEAQTVALFASLVGEPDMDPCFALAVAAGKRVVLPRCEGEETLVFHVVGTRAKLVPGAFGVLEPPAALPRLEVAHIELALVPGVAFDEEGGRLGRGRGYYDAAFPAGSGGPTLFGAGFEFQLVERVPTGPADRRLDAVLTERGWRRAEPGLNGCVSIDDSLRFRS